AMKLPRRNFLRLAAGAAALPAVSRIARAQAYPTRPVRLIIGFAPGASADTTARLMAQWLSERLGQSVVVESRPGGGTNIATEAVVRATPDGYTLLMPSGRDGGDVVNRLPSSLSIASFASYKAPRVHHAARRRGGYVAARGAGIISSSSRQSQLG